MSFLNETIVLNYYLDEVSNGSITFLKNRPQYSKKVSEGIIELRDAVGMNNKISCAKQLWKLLFEAAMTFIDPDKGGYDKLFKYFDEYVDFEELIFASDSFYRDHTLHCLWVYFLGEYILRHEEFKPIKNEMDRDGNEYLKMLDMFNSLNIDKGFERIIDTYKIMTHTLIYQDSIRCISAITHDLGYPLKKIEKINKAIKGILPYFSLNNYDEFNFSYSDIQQNYISRFIEFISDAFVGNTSEVDLDEEIEKQVFMTTPEGELTGINKEVLLKLTEEQLEMVKKTSELTLTIEKNVETYWRYCKDFEEYKHGIMSAYLLVKNVRAFNNINLKYADNSHCKFEHINISDVTSKQDILRAISNHTSEGYQIRSICNNSAFLTFIDELEEFSRISRANQNREYVEEFCDTNIYMSEGWFNIDFTFNNLKIDNLDPERAFKGRCDRFLSLFNISDLAENFKIRLQCISDLPYDKNTYTLEIGKKYAKIMINDEEKNIPMYLKSNQLFTREEYATL